MFSRYAWNNNSSLTSLIDPVHEVMMYVDDQQMGMSIRS